MSTQAPPAPKPQAPVRTPLLLQMEAVECGAAALGIVLAHYERIVPLPQLRMECGVSRDGSKASNVLKAARRYGMVAKGFKKSLETVKAVRFPAIVFWNFNHFVVLEGFKDDKVYINDPASGRRTVTFQEFDESYTGVVLVLEPGPEFEPGGEAPSVLGALRRNLRGSYAALLFCILVGFCLVIPGLAFPVLTQLFIDYVVIQSRPDWVTPLLTGMALTVLLEGLLRFLQLRHLRDLRVKLSVGMSSKFLWHVLHLPVGYFAQRFSGEISDRIGLNDGVAGLLSGQLARTAIDCIMPVFYALLLFYYDPFLTLVGIAGVLLNVLCLRVVARARVAANMRVLQEGGKLSGVAIAGLQSMETLKASAQESSFFARWAGYYAKTINAKQSMALADQILGIVPGLLASFTSLLVLVMGGVRVMDGAMTIGMLIAFQILLRKFQAPVDTLVDMASSLQTLGGDLGRLDDVLQHPVDPQTRTNLDVSDYGEASLQGFVELRGVTFGYSPIAPPLIEDFNLRLEPGQRVALVGGSGSGKSTIAKIIAGLYQPRAGQILLDGAKLSHIPRRVLANSLAMVEQEVFFFGGTVRDNLTLWDPTITDAVLEQACKDAAIHEVIIAMPGGYQAELLEGASNLSGGQRQRLEIARALVHTPSILILDEATSALDAETERVIDRNLRMRGCTCVVVAHRLSTIRDCDEIVVLRGGKVMQRGTYDELSADEDGEFFDLLRETGQA